MFAKVELSALHFQKEESEVGTAERREAMHVLFTRNRGDMICKGFDNKLCKQCKRHNSRAKKALVPKLKIWKSGRVTCLLFIQRG